MKYAVEIMNQDKPTYIGLDDTVKLVKAANAGAKLVYVGGDFINPSSISRLRRVWSEVDNSMIGKPEQEVIEAIESFKTKQLK